MTYLKQLGAQFSRNAIKVYLILANVLLVIFAIWFSNVGLLPFKNTGDFVFFVALALVFTLYRPGWAFVFFVGLLGLENVNLAPIGLGLAVRPYQLLGGLILFSIALRAWLRRPAVIFPKLKWFDGLPLLFSLGGFVSGLSAVSKSTSLKQAVVAVSFVALYFLVRVYIQSLADLKRIAPFFLSSGLVISVYAIWQNFRFSVGGNAFEVMLGRPNATFTEPDWLGVYLVFLTSIVLAIIFYCNKNCKNKKFVIFNFQFSIFNFLNYLFLIIIFTALLLTVSRSAWLGAILIILGFLKISLLYGEKTKQFFSAENGFWKNIWLVITRPWDWKQFWLALRNIFFVAGISLGIIFVFKLTNFQLANRAQSTSGWQKITIACQGGLDVAVPQTIGSVEELANYSCRHINLEEIEKEKNLGNKILEVYRPDPNVGIRARIYAVALEQIKQHPLLGIGWGSISSILGTDERGSGLNASNIFLEVWLGAGLLGFLAFVILWGYLLVASVVNFVKTNGSDAAATFVVLSLLAILIPNLFNSGIFLGFVWVFLAIAVGLLEKKKEV